MPDYLGLDGQKHTGRMARLTNRKAATGAVYIQEIQNGKKVLKSIIASTPWGFWFKQEGAAARQNDEKSWVVTTSYCGVYQIQTLAESLAEETTRLTAPMTWEQAVVALAEYQEAAE